MPNYDNYTKEQLIEELKKLKRQKKFGLVWEDKPEQVVEDCKHNFPVLTECPDRVIAGNYRVIAGNYRVIAGNDPQPPNHLDSRHCGLDPQSSTHLIIEGDNYHALSVLNVTHKGKIDVIYIDPPYNTGNKDFKYNDDYVDKEDSFRHSKWLSFMEKRLKLAKELLSDTGVIFISIDDNEQANLKLLCNSVFGENLTEMFIWKKSGYGRDGKMKNTTSFRIDHEYIIVCYKSTKSLNKINELPDFQNEYPNPDNDPRGPYKAGSISRKESASNPNHKNYYTVFSPTGKPFTRQFDVTKEDFEKLNNDIVKNKQGYNVSRIYWGKNNDAVPAIKIFIFEERSITPYSVLLSKGTTTEGTTEATEITGIDCTEMRPKPILLIETLLQLGIKNKNATILDFFAGTGTTGQAVLNYNIKYQSNTKFIIATNNENNIATTFTYPRIKKVIEGYGAAGSPTTAGIPANVRYFKTDFVEKSEDTDENRVKITERCHELLQIKEGCYDILTTNNDLPQINFYRNATKLMTVIFDRYDQKKDTYYIEEIAKQTRNNPNINEIVVYRFSIDGNLDMDISSLPNARLEEIPEEILKVYHQIFKKNKRKK